MRKINYKKIVSIAITIVLLLCIMIQPTMAWGGLTHFSLNRDAGMNSLEKLSAAVAPDALDDTHYRTNDLDMFVHEEFSGELYGPLDPFMCSAAHNSPQKCWAVGWMTHTTGDRASHGTLGNSSPYIDPNNYLSAVGANNLLEHLVAEFGGDILSYWFHQGTLPEELVVYPNQIRIAFKDYDKNYETIYSDEYNRKRYLEAFESLQAYTFAEQKILDIGQDKNPQLTDWAFLIWAYYTYYEPYNTYYNFAFNNVTSTACPLISAEGLPFKQNIDNTDVALEKIKVHPKQRKIKIDVGRQLIDEGLVIPHRKSMKGAVYLSFKQTVSDKELLNGYKQYLEESYEKHTGKKVKIMDEIISKNKHISIVDVKKDYPELYNKLIEKGVLIDQYAK